jgi:hypothetical protein
VASGSIAPTSVVQVKPNDQQRTYDISDAAGNTLRLVMRVQKAGGHLKARVVSTQYGSAAPSPSPENLTSYHWAFRGNGALQHLLQSFESGAAIASADFNGSLNRTTITRVVPLPASVQIRPGLVLLQVGIVSGNFAVGY